MALPYPNISAAAAWRTAIGVGNSANDGLGDPLRTAFQRANARSAGLELAVDQAAVNFTSLDTRTTSLEGSALMMNPRGEWVTGTEYVYTPGARRDWFTYLGNAYVVAVTHTAGAFATDETAGRFFPSDAAQMYLDAKQDIDSILDDLSGVGAGLGARMVGFSSSRTVHQKLMDVVSVKDFGAVGDGVADDTAAIQSCLDHVNTIGATAFFPAGDYKVTSALTIDNTADTGSVEAKASIKGEGKSSSRIIAAAGDYQVLRLLGGVVDAGMHSQQQIDGISIVKSGGDGVGIYLSNIAFCVVREVLVTGAGIGISGEDVLSSYFEGCQFVFNGRGVNFIRQEVSDGYQSGPNSLTFVACVIGNNADSGGYFLNGGCINFFGGSVEGNGITGTGIPQIKFGLLVSNAGLESAVGLNIVGTYFEINHGVADVWIANAINSVAHSITGATFNRISSTNFVSHNILVETSGPISADLRLNGCGFKSAGSYVPSGSRLTVHQLASDGARNRLSWDGCVFSSASDSPIARNHSASIAAFSSVNASGVLLGDKMNVASATRNNTGDYTINYYQPLEISRHVAIATPLSDVVPSVFEMSESLVRFRFSSRATGTLTDTDFSFVSIGR